MAQAESRRAGVLGHTAPGAMLGNSAMTRALRASGVAALGHGFRSSFKDWTRHERFDELLS